MHIYMYKGNHTIGFIRCLLKRTNSAVESSRATGAYTVLSQRCDRFFLKISVYHNYVPHHHAGNVRIGITYLHFWIFVEGEKVE
jgi:hypothetical protein